MFSTPYASSRLTGPPLPKDVGLGEDKWGMFTVLLKDRTFLSLVDLNEAGGRF